MKLSVAALLTVAGLATAQFDGVPECGVNCLQTAIQAIGCDVNNSTCSCQAENQSQLASDLVMVSCLTASCSSDQLADVISAGNKLCAKATASQASSSTGFGTASHSRLGFAAASGIASSTTAPLPSSTQHDSDISGADAPTFPSAIFAAAVLIGAVQWV
ncbi:hypothetical protein CFIMG_001294RA [Ceratocystis fimbriata CBS 114723]|uniref:CFEM domain-containing protein n=1 Tax=Ceratocystis fimbriata CBS 114723 TaxID=1035309 RepID=A0A2C5X5B5_9PEZI|nr:hypothetical protein CFIMG_001294RA [Ceratocystis fimbriata CBS 114723]